jgi:hypothetical protein
LSTATGHVEETDKLHVLFRGGGASLRSALPAILGMVEAAPVPPPKSSFRPVYWYWTMAIRTIRSALNSETHLVIVYMAMRSALKCRSAICILLLLVMDEIKKVAS